LAPMVRVGTLPARLLALQYGADIVFCEEIIDHRILMCKRVENAQLGTVDFVIEEDAHIAPVFRTCPAKEKHALVFQMGTADPQRALEAAKLLEDVVAGIDINMGCPKAYSIKGGMGAALLSEQEKVVEILTTLVKGVKIPVTCKIRLLGSDRDPDLEKTKAFVRACCSTGIAGITVHGRTRDERPRHPNHDDLIAALRPLVDEFQIPLVANGGSNEVKTQEDIRAFRSRTKADSVMLARAAMWNFSIFRKEGPLPLDTIVRDYLRLCVQYENATQNTKYVVQHILQDQVDSPRGHAVQAAANLKEVCAAWESLDVFEEESRKLEAKEKAMAGGGDGKRKAEEEEASANKKCKEDEELIEECVVIVNVKFVRKEFPTTGASPKSILAELSKKNDLNLPTYKTIQREKDKLFRSVLTLGREKFTSERWEKSKRFAEQSAALAYLTFYKMDTGKKPSLINVTKTDTN